MGNCMSFADNIFFKRAKLCAIVVVSYADVLLDVVNAYKLFKAGDKYWGSCLTALLIVPNLMTWNFLYANGVAQWKDLPVVMLQLGPLYALCGTWRDGDSTADLLWYTASEGLLEAPCTGVLTAYIMTFGGEFSPTFYLSIVASFLSIAKTAVMMNFYGRDPSIVELSGEFLSRFFDVTLRVSSLACYGYLMRSPGGITDMDEESNTQSALPAWMMASFLTSMCMISMTEPKCELKVTCFFGSCMVFTPPLRFLNVFDQMYFPFIVYRSVETLLLICTASFPLQLNPQLWELGEQCPFVVLLMLSSAACQVVFYLIKVAVFACMPCCYGRTSGYDSLTEIDSAFERAESLQKKLITSVSARDVLMTNLLVQFGAQLHDVRVVGTILSEWPKAETTKKACENLKKKGLPQSLKEFTLKECKDAGFDAAFLKKAGFDAKELKGGFEPAELMRAGFGTEELKQAGFDAEELKRALKEFTWKECKDVGFDALVLKKAGFDAWELRGGFETAEVMRAGFDTEEMMQAGFDVEELKMAEEDKGTIVFFDEGGSRVLVRFTRVPLGFTFENKIPIVVAEVAQEGHAQELGVRAGWTLITIEGVNVEGLDFDQTKVRLKKMTKRLTANS